MKNTIFLIVIASTLLFFSCGNKENEKTFVKNSGKVLIVNGKGVADSIQYTCDECEKNKVDTSIFNEVVNKITECTRNTLKYPLSFIPIKIEIGWIKQDSLKYFDNGNIVQNLFTVYYEYHYIAKNGYGNELEGDQSGVLILKDNQIMPDDFINELQAKPLEFDSNNIPNITLDTKSALDNAYINIQPTLLEKLLIVKSSINCISKGSILTITFDNGDAIELTSWNDFNCDGTSYFGPLDNIQIEAFKSHKLQGLVLLDKYGTGVISTTVPKNKADYLIQYAIIVDKK